jgi:hypothetical protein
MEDDIILKQHPENPLILDILIQTKKVIKSTINLPKTILKIL